MRRQAGRQACISKRESLSMFCLQVAKWTCSRYTDTVHVDLLSICMYVNLPDTLIRVDLPPPRVNLIIGVVDEPLALMIQSITFIRRIIRTIVTWLLCFVIAFPIFIVVFTRIISLLVGAQFNNSQ